MGHVVCYGTGKAYTYELKLYADGSYYKGPINENHTKRRHNNKTFVHTTLVLQSCTGM